MGRDHHFDGSFRAVRAHGHLALDWPRKRDARACRCFTGDIAPSEQQGHLAQHLFSKVGENASVDSGRQICHRVEKKRTLVALGHQPGEAVRQQRCGNAATSKQEGVLRKGEKAAEDVDGGLFVDIWR